MCNGQNHYAGCGCRFGGAWYTKPVSANSARLGYIPESITYPITCNICGQQIYHYKNEHGSSVLFDELGHPWQKHECFVIVGSASRPIESVWRKAEIMSSKVGKLVVRDSQTGDVFSLRTEKEFPGSAFRQVSIRKRASGKWELSFVEPSHGEVLIMSAYAA